MADIAALIDKHRRLCAEAAGVQVEICMAVGDRDGAYRALNEQKAHTQARQAAAWTQPCYFADDAGALAQSREVAIQ